MRKVAITGGIASGKSTVCRFLRELGAYVINADDIVHNLLNPKTPLGKEICTLLGRDVVVGGEFDREKIAQKVFRDQTLLKRLEELLHPEVQRLIEEKYSQTPASYSLFVAEVPLLFEAHMESWYDHTIAVIADERVCKERFGDTQEFVRRQSRLIPPKELARHADYVIINDSNLEELKQSTTLIYQKIT